MNKKTVSNAPLLLILLLFFVSGALALVYEVVWSRMLMHVFGSTALAVGTVLAAFMSGMAIGSWRIGKLADRHPNCLRLYAQLEIGIALTALIAHLLLARIAPAHLAIHSLVGSFEPAFVVVRFLLVFVLIVAPTVLMGATLPVLTRFLVGRQGTVGVKLSTLYATNTLGAVSGVLVTGFYLIGEYGIHLPVTMAVLANVLVGSVAWMASKRYSPATPDAADLTATAEGTSGPGQVLGTGTYRLILAGLAISGFTSFAYEIYWTRSLVFILGNSTYALTTMLSAFLTGIALGSYGVRFLLNRVPDRAVLFGWIQVCLGLFSALALPLLFAVDDPRVLNQFVSQITADALPMVMASFGIAFLVMLIPAMLIGATFPLVGQIGVREVSRTGSSVGRIYAINTLGNVLGALLPGWILLAWLGIQKGILAMAVLNLTLGLVVLSVRLMRPRQHPGWRLMLPLLAVFSLLLMSSAPLDFQFPSQGEAAHHESYYYREGPLATTKVYGSARNHDKHMSVDGIVIGGTGNVEFKQLLLAHLPKLLLEDVSSELSVGLGSGMLAGESALHPRVRDIIAVEIEPSVVEGAGWFTEENHDVLNSPKLTVVTDDIGNFLRTNTGLYQVISADEKTADEFASNGFSYSREYYQLLREHLAPGGLVAQWVPTTLPPSQYRMILKTFAGRFPHVQLWYFLPAYKKGPFNTIMIGSNEPVVIDYERIDRTFADHPQAFQSLARYGLTSAEAVLPHFIADETVLRDAVESANINSLDHPRYEFFAPWEYAIANQAENVPNHDFLIELKRLASADIFTRLKRTTPDVDRLRQTLTAEDRYLAGFRKFLDGMPSYEIYREFDQILAMAPWNDSLRARIYSQYDHMASNAANSSQRAMLQQRADNLYPAN